MTAAFAPIRRLAARFLICALAALALLPGSTAAAAAGMGAEEARHLLLRTSFYAAPDEVHKLASLTRAQAVERILAGARSEPSTQPDAQLDGWLPRSQLRAMSEQDRRKHLRETLLEGQELRGWWLNEMLVTPSPFTERMTLFWHNHFVSSLRKVRATRLMYRQNLLLRRHALGNFRELLHAVARDPAMVVYLDGASNRKGQPNENFAREVMELFTLGEGHYGEMDVKEAARAFTGWGMDGETGEFSFRRALHDDGVKTVLGVSGPLDGADVLEILLAQRQTAEHVVRKLWREFVSPQPDPREVERIAAEFRRSGYDIRAAVRALLGSDAFYAPENRASLVKSPVELLVGTLRQFEFEVSDPFAFVVVSRQLGQDLMAPPNVKGWPGGESWINAGTLLARKQILERLFRDSERTAPAPSAAMSLPAAAAAAPMQATSGRYQKALQSVRFDASRWSSGAKATTPQALAAIVLPAAPVNAIEPAGEPLALLRQLVLDPTYQLK